MRRLVQCPAFNRFVGRVVMALASWARYFHVLFQHGLAWQNNLKCRDDRLPAAHRPELPYSGLHGAVHACDKR